MPEEKKSSIDAIVRNVVGGVILLGMGWMISTSNDRYRGTEAERDFANVYRALERLETRLTDRIKEHSTAGPHDDVAERLRAIEIQLRLLNRSSFQVEDEQ